MSTPFPTGSMKFEPVNPAPKNANGLGEEVTRFGYVVSYPDGTIQVFNDYDLARKYAKTNFGNLDSANYGSPQAHYKLPNRPTRRERLMEVVNQLFDILGDE